MGERDQPGRVDAGVGTDPADPGVRQPVPHRPDLFLTETAALADVVLPAAGWGEKTGTFTNVNRTVHLSEQAVTPPGQAGSDLDIFLLHARRMGLSDQDGAPLPAWDDAEGAFEAWREASRGRPVDYTGLSYAKLRGSGGIPWPVTEAAPDGTDRLYTDGVFPTDTEVGETYGHDLVTGAQVTEQEHRAQAPGGRPFLKGTPYQPPHEEPSEEFPLLYTTGRTVHQFHTRTKTGRARSLTPPRRTPGSSSRAPTPPTSMLPRVTSCEWSPRAARSRSLLASVR